jgi:PhnB protein
MPRLYKPEGHSSVSPYLMVSGADATIAFLVRAFDAVPGFRMADATGRVHHAEVKIDDSVVMLSDGMAGYPPLASHVHVYVPDVDAAYERALAAGATSVQKPMKKDDPDKRGGVKDAGGTTWWISTHMP